MSDRPWLLDSLRQSLGLKPDAPDPATISVEQTARWLGISRGLAYEGVRDGSITSVRVGKRILVPVAALLELLQRSAMAPSYDGDPGSGVLDPLEPGLVANHGNGAGKEQTIVGG